MFFASATQKQEAAQQKDFEMNADTSGLTVAGHIGTWHTIDQHEIGGHSFYLMEHTPYATLTSQMIRDALAIPYEPVSITAYDGLPLYGKCYLASPKAPWLIINTAIALVAGLCMFPVIFAFGMEPDLGPRLIFKTMPMVFSQMPFGRAFGTLFFILVLIAAALTAIGFIEAIAGALADATKWKKKSASF